MRSALGMADFILTKEAGGPLFNPEKKKEECRCYLADLFRPIERALGANIGLAAGGDDDVLYAITSSGLNSNRNPIKANFLQSVKGEANVAAVFTANRCIIAHTNKKGREMVRTIPYDEITGIEPRQFDKNRDGRSCGQLILSTTTDVVCFNTEYQAGYFQFDPDQAYEAVMALVTRYKQGKYAARQAPRAPRAASPAAGNLSPETVEALNRLKSLLDAGILTQEEFDANKRHLLGI